MCWGASLFSHSGSKFTLSVKHKYEQRMTSLRSFCEGRTGTMRSGDAQSLTEIDAGGRVTSHRIRRTRSRDSYFVSRVRADESWASEARTVALMPFGRSEHALGLSSCGTGAGPRPRWLDLSLASTGVGQWQVVDAWPTRSAAGLTHQCAGGSSDLPGRPAGLSHAGSPVDFHKCKPRGQGEVVRQIRWPGRDVSPRRGPRSDK